MNWVSRELSGGSTGWGVVGLGLRKKLLVLELLFSSGMIWKSRQQPLLERQSSVGSRATDIPSTTQARSSASAAKGKDAIKLPRVVEWVLDAQVLTIKCCRLLLNGKALLVVKGVRAINEPFQRLLRLYRITHLLKRNHYLFGRDLLEIAHVGVS